MSSRKPRRGSDPIGIARPVPARDLIKGDLIVTEGEEEWIEWLVLGVRAEEDETLAVLMDFHGGLRCWDGPSDTRHFVLRRPQTDHASGGQYARA